MAEDRLTIDPATVFNNVDERQIEFAAEIGGDVVQFAVRYDVIEALSGQAPGDDALPLFQRHLARIQMLGATALERGPARELVVISESDLDQDRGATGADRG